jgi:hypothetical protein
MLRTRKTPRRAFGAGLAVAVALALPAVAAADDQSVYNSFHFSHPRFKKLREDFDRGFAHWEDSQYREPGDAYRACRRTATLSRKVVAKMQVKEVSSETGAQARRAAVLGLKDRRRWADAERTAIEAFMDFDGATYIERRRKARKYIARAQDHEADAQKLFKQAGVNRNP